MSRDTLNNDNNSVEKDIHKRAAHRIRRNSEQRRSVWFGLGTFGVVGWSIAVPAAVGAFLGMWIDRRIDRPESWTLMLLFTGLAVGCANAWRWISRESEDSP